MSNLKIVLSFIGLLSLEVLSAQGGFRPSGEAEQDVKQQKKSKRCGTSKDKEDCNEVLEFDENTQKVYHSKTGKPFTGTCESCHDNGKQQHLASFKDGKEDGQSSSFYPNGDQESLRSFNYGVEEGDWKFWFSPKEGGKLAWHHTYSQGKKHGKWIWYYNDETHSERKIENYNMGLLEGLSVKYWKPGKVKSEINFKGGSYHGSYVTYHINGQKSVEVSYNKGKENGPVKHYYKSGQISKEGEWKNGVKEGKWGTYFKTGTDHTVENFVNGELEGKHYVYFEDGGKIKIDETYKKGLLYEQTLFDIYGNYVNSDGKIITKEDVEANNNILRATADSKGKKSKKKKKKKKKKEKSKKKKDTKEES